jgi:capsular exopolysaccharide synthesis family protein
LQESTRVTNVRPASSKEDLALTDLWLIVRKRRLLLACAAVGLGLLAAADGYNRGKLYTASGEMQIQPGSAAELKQSISSVLGGGGSLDVVIESDSRILTSDKLLTMVAGVLKLQDNETFMRGHPSLWTRLTGAKSNVALHGNLDDPGVRSSIVGNLRGHLVIARVPRTQMITISYTSSSPKLSADIVNALESEFIKNNFITHYSSTQQVTNWLTSQIDDLRAVVQNSQDQMVDLQKKLGITALDPNHSLIVQEIGELEKGAEDATEQRGNDDARYHILQSLPPSRIQDSSIVRGMEGSQGQLTSLRTQRAQMQADLARLQPVYGPNYPQVKQLNAQIHAMNLEIAREEGAVVDKAKDSLDIAHQTEDRAKGLLDSRVHELYGQRDDIVRYALLTEEYESNRRMYESILARLREAAVDAGLDSADISVVDLASLPMSPSSTSPVRMGEIGLLFGLLGGMALALLLEKMDTRMRDSKHIQELLGLSALAIIPQTNWKGKEAERELGVGPEILWDARSSFSEAIRVLRTSMQLSSTARQSRVVAVTSCQPGEGKSTVSTNMAAALAQGGKKVVLVDTDMRRPSIYWRLGLTAKTGLSEYLTGNQSLDAVIQTHETLTTLDLIPSGFSPPLPADLLGSDQMKTLVQLLRERYEYVIFDTPPALSVTDPLIVSSLSDGLVLVIRQGYCTRAMLSRAAEIFRGVDVKVYGFVLNGVDASLPEYYGYLGYYSYEYKS